MRCPVCVTLAALALAPGSAQTPSGDRREPPPASTQAWQLHAARSHAVLARLQQDEPRGLPPPPAGVSDVRFTEFFGPIGDRGLDYTPRLRALDGGRVRLVGHMVREQVHRPGLFLFAGWPTTVQTSGPCTYDDAPPTAVHVFLPGAAPRPVPYRPGRLVLTGRLELGPRPEADGRNSTVRLYLDEDSAAQFSPAPASSAP